MFLLFLRSSVYTLLFIGLYLIIYHKISQKAPNGKGFGPISVILVILSVILIASVNAKELTFATDRKSTRLNSSHANISYAVFCLKKKKNNLIYNYMSIKTVY